MNDLKIYCFTGKNFHLFKHLPQNILPLGLGNNFFPEHYLHEKVGDNMLELNKYFAEMTGIYWVYKNKLNDFDKNDWIGFCHYRRYWLNDLYKQKHGIKGDIFSHLLNNENDIFSKFQTIMLQPTVLKNENIREHFNNNHGDMIMEHSFKILDNEMSSSFQKYLENREFSICNMFITKPEILKKYCEFVFPFMKKLLEFCFEHKLCEGKNQKLPSYFIERFTSFWFHEYSRVGYLSYIQLNKYFTSNFTNKFYNSLKTPLSFNLCPTILDI
tara:strand:+ start:359 stop:1171 length:813 start_codon:yes stop_codon:yes gene_type:complete